MHSDGRWHNIGRPVVYTAESSALALLEALVHLDQDAVPSPYQLLMIDAPDDLSFASFPDQEAPQDQSVSAAWGDAWLTGCETPLAHVPAAGAPFSVNWLINPLHADAGRIRIGQHGRWPWDRRLFR